MSAIASTFPKAVVPLSFPTRSLPKNRSRRVRGIRAGYAVGLLVLQASSVLGDGINRFMNFD
ncbi:hypothetical protein [Sphingomonas albertensis]|uniref:Uncharacterized protein n=1 Tax=Sphingomonas albertensis TaxID=2762591 RepID=A0ABR7ANE6_9SPHN|nr:hypothetical protein [Sphingomonas albertensis]MBC3941974.1 hypothetical protein [Sphingomonas albertensis]